ncbi:MAG: protein translocase subunit SecD [Waddliaceae bacterium]|jgi:SecD/SecF fusion protein|nr:protein translocase subunit SecD [Waddliaceae bacterium]MBT3578566.1 protein translocase subunit SecD [Waddliaceae bacterium]MBT6928690.1 protein translocase subunit SecD [Waddliaceae bacterium]MBT7264922.1 protein translocase subunit SecD [Waddliaceae bacterium]
MEKHKRWQFYLIIVVIALTIYNIFPTVFYYSKPLKKPLNEGKALVVARDIAKRVNSLEKDSISWLKAYCKHISVKPKALDLDVKNPDTITVSFVDGNDAERFRTYLARAGELIPFIPAQLQPLPSNLHDDGKLSYVVVKRRIGVHFSSGDVKDYFTFSEKSTADGFVSPLYREIVYDRASHLGINLGGDSAVAEAVAGVVDASDVNESLDTIVALSTYIVDFADTFGVSSSITKRYYSSFSQGGSKNPSETIRRFTSRVTEAKDLLVDKIKEQEKGNDVVEGGYALYDEQGIKILKGQHSNIVAAEEILKKYSSVFKDGKDPLTKEQILSSLLLGDEGSALKSKRYPFALGDNNPFIEKIVVDWDNDSILLYPHDDLFSILDKEAVTEEDEYRKDKVNKLLINEVAAVSRVTDEAISPLYDYFSMSLNAITGSTGFLALDLEALAVNKALRTKDLIMSSWSPQHQDLKSDVFPVWDYETYRTLSPEDQQLGLVVIAPVAYDEDAFPLFKDSSLYVVAKGLETIIEQHQSYSESKESGVLMEDLASLQSLLRGAGFITDYPGKVLSSSREYLHDHIFESSNYYDNFLSATREDFRVYGSRKHAVLEFSDYEQRLITLNAIDNSAHEDLLKWRDDFHAARISTTPMAKYEVPPLTKSILADNFRLSAKKYFRGDDRKILKWGLDLSGGKTVVIELRDQNNKTVDGEEDLSLAVNELTSRVNKMGVAEVNIHTEDSKIVMDFPGSQGLSASELVKSSAMYFHIVNEKFSQRSPALGKATEHFLQDVWNEAVVTDKTDIENINEIAWRQLGGDNADEGSLQQLTENARILYDNGLRLPSPKDTSRANAFDDTLSMVAIYRGDTYKEWRGQSHPLLVVFNNYALEGSLLEDVRTSYDPSDGNVLSFGVKSSYTSGDGVKSSPREDFYSWTSQFSKDKISGTPKESFSQGSGWRMSVILNGQVVSDPTLKAALRNGGMISGSFTQRDINRLASDLRAGSLSFTPKILREENISADLGKQERSKGIYAAAIGLALVIAAMVGVYSFFGIVASCAVLFNLLIMWGVLQNLDAALTLPGIAGIILTIGMAVDANVLVFERIREEFSVSGKLASAVQKGYEKAFSAIVDSNITTIIAALILIQFDSGPIKGFAITLIIGIASSMFTALFVTRYFFTGWLEKSKEKILNMRHLITATKIDFIKLSRTVVIALLAVIVIGGSLLVSQRHSIMGMDFTGGYALNVSAEESIEGGYRATATKALIDSGLSVGEFQVRELNKPTHLRIQLGMNMELQGNPFHGMSEENTDGTFSYNYERNPRIAWVVNALEEGGLVLDVDTMSDLDQHWNSMSGQLSDTMMNNAFMGLGFALICILIYITLRFEFKYAVSAIVCLIHDVFITLGIVAILYKMGVAIQIDLIIIGAIMTIIGYSLNDTIIIFDRIREDIRIFKKLTFPELINHALNVTLSRTLMTSLTTLLVLVALVVFGGSGIFDFALVMAIGVVFGTLSSLFVASPIMLYFHNREK